MQTPEFDDLNDEIKPESDLKASRLDSASFWVIAHVWPDGEVTIIYDYEGRNNVRFDCFKSRQHVNDKIKELCAIRSDNRHGYYPLRLNQLERDIIAKFK